MRRLKFEMIADSRFTKNIDKEIERLRKGTSENLKSLGVKFETTDNFDLVWPPETKGGSETRQHRVIFYVEKEGRKITWNDVYATVNIIKPVPYNFI